MYSVGSVKAIRSVLAKATVRQQKKRKKKVLKFRNTGARDIFFVADFQPGEKRKEKKKAL